MKRIGPLWQRMNEHPRVPASTFSANQVPTDPGVYAWYRDGAPVYVGKAGDLNQRVWKNHMGRGVVMTGSAFRRNVSQHLGIATAADIQPAGIGPPGLTPTRGSSGSLAARSRGSCPELTPTQWISKPG